MKKLFAWMLIATMVATLSGCATVKKKFKRRKKQEITRPVVYTEKEFIKPYSNAYYYASHFNMWKVWQEELIKFLDGTAKKRKRAGVEVKNHLADMKSYLVEEKGLGARDPWKGGALTEISARQGAPQITTIAPSRCWTHRPEANHSNLP